MTGCSSLIRVSIAISTEALIKQCVDDVTNFNQSLILSSILEFGVLPEIARAVEEMGWT